MRAFSLVTGRDQWFMPLLAFGGIQIALLIVGMIPIIGLIATLATIVLGIHMQGWVAAIQRRAIYDQPGLPEPFDGEYIGSGFRAVVVAFVWILPVMIPALGAGVVAAVAMEELDPDVGPIVLVGVMGLIGVMMLVWMPLVQIAVVRTNLASDWSGFQVGAVFQMLAKTAVESYLGMVLWWFVGVALMLLGLLACIVGMYVAQPFLYATMGVFWVDVYKLAVERGAPPVQLPEPPISDIARTFE